MLPSDLTHASSRAIIRPPCPDCGATMMLTRIEPDGSGYEMHTFECTTCDHSECATVRFL
jgi:hypothetical protein